MTKTAGRQILAAPCCGRHYAFPIYRSVNYSASAYWTDGWRDHSPMPNDEGLRQCGCGSFVMLKNLIEVEAGVAGNIEIMNSVTADALPDCIARTHDKEVETAARLEYWHHLNHAYRDIYRAHREKEEAATQARRQAQIQNKIPWWRKFTKGAAPNLSQPVNDPFTFPAFEPTSLQADNMSRLANLIIDSSRITDNAHILLLAELYREQKLFEYAEGALSKLDEAELGVRGRVMAEMIEQRVSAPIRYRL